MKMASSGTGSQQLVPFTREDAEKFIDALTFIREMSKRGAKYRKTAAELLIKLNNLSWPPEGPVKAPKQVSLKPSELKLLRDLRDTYNIETVYFKGWHVPD